MSEKNEAIPREKSKSAEGEQAGRETSSDGYAEAARKKYLENLNKKS